MMRRTLQPVVVAGCAAAFALMFSTAAIAQPPVDAPPVDDPPSDAPTDEPTDNPPTPDPATPDPATPGDAPEGEPSADEPSGESDQEAYAQFQLGNRRYAEGRYVEAIAAFKAAYALSPRPQLLFNLANVFERLGQLDEAITFLGQFQELADPSQRPTVAARIANLKRRAAAIEAAKPKPVKPCPTVLPEQANTTAWMRPTSYVVGGFGALSLIGSAIVGGLALSARSSASDDCVDGLCSTGASTAIDRDHDLSIAADVTLGVGITALSTGLILFLVSLGNDEPDELETTPAAAIQWSLTQAGVGITW